MTPRLWTMMRRIVVGVAVILFLFLLMFALPFELWRTGRPPHPPLTLNQSAVSATPPARIWIDTDAACGYGPRTDPDDCFALWLLAHTPTIEIAGISTVFGNAPLAVTDRTTRGLVDLLEAEGARLPEVHRGAAAPESASAPAPITDAALALRAALADAPLTIVALGPLTNIAAALHHSGLSSRVAGLVAVMGRRPGHLFHPAEGAGTGILFGHGPVFRDFNAAQDPDAVAAILDRSLPLILSPYEAARAIEITGHDLDRLAREGGARTWIAARSRGWLAYWRKEVGRDGFYPFDAVAAAYVRNPRLLQCADVRAWVGDDPAVLTPFWKAPALLVTQNPDDISNAQALGDARYCPAVAERFDRTVRAWLNDEG